VKFKDHFSGQAADYAKYRPDYPQELFAYLASLTPARQCAWDCGTGNGQAAVGLAAFFDRVVATDASERQILNARRNARIDYRVAPAGRSDLASGSLDLITVAQALHWFELDAFYIEAKRVLKPQGVLAAWYYNLLEIAPEIDAIVNRFYYEIVGAYWPPELKIIEERYQTISFPLAELNPPTFSMRASWTLAQLLGYLRTWSATRAFMAANQADPIEPIISDLTAAWEKPDRRRLVRWPLTVRAGRFIP
jgi:SAM-dependent methyltransferase